MSKGQTLRALVTERLTAAAEDIFVLFERTIAEYEEELCRSKEENQRKQRRLEPGLSPRGLQPTAGATVHIPPGLSQDPLPETAQIKEEPEEQSFVKQEEDQLPVWVPESSAFWSRVQREESSLFQQRRTEHRQETRDVSSEPHFHSETQGHSFDTDNDHWESPFSCSEGDLYNQVQSRDSSNKLSLKYTFEPETSTTVTDGDASGSDAAQGREQECPFCKKKFRIKRDLQVHIRVHTGERPYSCTICKKAFSQTCTLKVHMRTHTNEKPFICSICNKGFIASSYLKTHMRTHTGEKPYSCSLCNKEFNQSCNLKTHMRTQHIEKPELI